MNRPWAEKARKQGTGPLSAVWMVYAILGVALTAYLISAIVRQGQLNETWLDGWGVVAVDFIGAALCLGRGWWLWHRGRPLGLAALVLGASLLSWGLGDAALTVESLHSSPPTPSLADLFYLSFYPMAYVAVVLFMQARARHVRALEWLDGANAGLGAAAVCAAFAFQAVQTSTGQGVLATVTGLAYPIGDVLLLGLVVGGFAIIARPGDRSWVLLAAGLALNVAGDTSNLFQNSLGASAAGSVVNGIAWPAAIVIISAAVWVGDGPTDLLAPVRTASFLLPGVTAASALVVLVVGCLRQVDPVAIGLATAALSVVGVRLVASVRRVQSISEDRHRQSITDELTGLGNRRRLFGVLDSYFAEYQSSDQCPSLAFLFIDLNHFKEINDSFGHPAGDGLLRELGSRLSGSLRSTDLLVRLGGDEFAVLLMDGRLDFALSAAHRVYELLDQPFQLGTASVTVGASIGIAIAPQDAADANGLVWAADIAMYRAKLSNQPVAHFQENLDGGRDQMRLLEELRTAIDEGQLVLHYQPQLDLHSGKIGAMEALVRWEHPRLGLVPPIQFLPLAEEAGLMTQLTGWVIVEAVRQAAAWRSMGHILGMAVNVSPHILLEPGFVNGLVEALNRFDVPGSSLIVEVTESGVIADLQQTRSVIDQLRTHGITVSIDDFGAGVTSLAYLGNLQVGELKLDRSFVASLALREGDRDLDLVRSTIELGHTIGLRVVAEGIEDDETLKLLTNLGCDVAQGYCIGRPKPADQIAFRPTLAA